MPDKVKKVQKSDVLQFRLLSSLFILLLIAVGTASSVLLVQQNQDIRKSARCLPADCKSNNDCASNEICKADCCVRNTSGSTTTTKLLPTKPPPTKPPPTKPPYGGGVTYKSPPTKPPPTKIPKPTEVNTYKVPFLDLVTHGIFSCGGFFGKGCTTPTPAPPAPITPGNPQLKRSSNCRNLPIVCKLVCGYFGSGYSCQGSLCCP